MSLILYINGQRADLEPGTVIAQTRQVNDLNSLENRQAGYTNKFSLPKTAYNLRLMQHLTLPGNTSNIPYQKNECSLYSTSGECFVYKGWAVITDGGDSFEAVIYDGIIDLYKAIEGQNLSVLQDALGSLSHEKTVAAVIASWNPANATNYRYILADYNGKTGDTNATAGGQPQVNIDYVVPSVNVAWLWKELFAFYGVTYSGSVFLTQNFKNLWMTYPKGTESAEATEDAFATDDVGIYNASANSTNPLGDHYWRTMLLKYRSATLQNPQMVNPTASSHYIYITEPGYYTLRVTGKVNTKTRAHIFAALNLPATSGNGLDTVQPYITVVPNQQQGTDFDVTSQSFYLNVGDELSLLMRNPKGTGDALRINGTNPWENLEYTLSRVSLGNIDFGEAFSDFPIRDFMSEVVHRFGLTLFKDKYTNHYEFLTLHEVLQNPQTEDWSGKFSRKKSENYIYGSYARQNNFRYAYNDKESVYNDGFIPVENQNLPESRDVLKSKIYSPEKVRPAYLGKPHNVYRLWDKETVENPAEGEDPVKYKSLDKRYCFLRATAHTGSMRLYSDTTDENVPVTSAWVESYWKLPFADILQDYYTPLTRILDKAQIVTAELWLSDADMVGLDFRKLYYIEQLSSYFILNKVSNYIPGRLTTCELVRVAYGQAEVELPAINIVKASANLKPGQEDYRITLEYSANYPLGTVQFQYGTGPDDEMVWQNVNPQNILEWQSPALFKYPVTDGPGETFNFRILDTQNNIYSNISHFSVL